MLSFPTSTGNSLLNYLSAQSAGSSDSSSSASTTAGTNATATNARVAATAQAALQTAGSTHRASLATGALDRQQAKLGTEMRAALSKAGVKLSDAVEFSVSSDGKVALKGSDADKTAMQNFLKADTSRPGFAMRIATQAKDALKLSGTIQQSAAISQAARYGGKSSGVMSLYTSLMAQSSTSTAVFSVSATSSALTYPGSLAAKA